MSIKVHPRSALALALVAVIACEQRSRGTEQRKSGRIDTADAVRASTSESTEAGKSDATRPPGSDTAAEVTPAPELRASLAESPPAFATDEQWGLIREAYARRSDAPIWSDAGKASSRLAEMITALCRADAQGLRRTRFDLTGLRNALRRVYGQRARDPSALADLDLRLTALYLQYASQLQQGELDLAARDTGWYVRSRRAAADSALRRGLSADRFDAMVAAVSPAQRGYPELLATLQQYREIAAAGGWPRVPDGEIRRGSRGAAVDLLRDRLAASGDLAGGSGPGGSGPSGGSPGADRQGGASDRQVYDQSVASAVARFQSRHGLTPDSLVGSATRAALNVPIESRISHIELNLDRHRWLPVEFGQRYIVVNIPAFMLYAHAGGSEKLAMRVVVGSEYEGATPIFADSLTHLEFQPYWNVPSSILAKELLPKIVADRSYLSRNNFEVLRAGEQRTVAPAAIEWSEVRGTDPGVRLRQLPGGDNPMGRVKFMLPNQFNIYLHDTPDRAVFDRRDRTLSHGCIRVERPAELAGYALERTAGWDGARIRKALAPSAEDDRRVDLARDVPIYIVYLTAFWRDGMVHFRDDVYGMDQQFLAASPPPANRPGDDSLCAELAALVEGGDS